MSYRRVARWALLVAATLVVSPGIGPSAARAQEEEEGWVGPEGDQSDDPPEGDEAAGEGEPAPPPPPPDRPRPEQVSPRPASAPERPIPAPALPAASPGAAAERGTGEPASGGPRPTPAGGDSTQKNGGGRPAGHSGGGAGAISAAAPAINVRAVATEAELGRHLEARASYLRSSDAANAEIELGALLEARQSLGVRNVVVASALLMHESAGARERGELPRAIQLAETAARLSPDLAATHWLRARLYFQRSWTEIDLVVGALGDVVSAKLRRFRNVVALLSNVSGGLALSILATILAFTVIQVFKHVRYPAYDLARVLPRSFGPAEGVMVLLIGIASPLMFGLGLACAVVLALASVHAYQASRERLASVLAMVWLAAFPGIIYLAAPLVVFHGSIVDSMETAMSEAFAGEAEQKLEQFTRTTGRGDLESALVLAHRYRMRGDVQSAEAEYRRVLSVQPGNVIARNNLGTLLYLLGREDAAMATFQSVSHGAERAEPLLNMASMLLDQTRFEEANKLIERARKIDPTLTERYTRFDASVSTADKLLYAELGQETLWARLFEVEEERRVLVTQELWSAFGGEMPPLFMPLFVLAAGLIARLLSRRAEELRLSMACPKCGVPARRDAPSTYCDQCQSVFLKTIAVEPMLRIAKEEDVRGYQRRRRWIERGLSVVAGAGHMFGGRPIAGGILFFLLALAVGAIRFAEGIVVHPWAIGVDPSAQTFQMGAAAVLAAIFVVISVRSSFK